MAKKFAFLFPGQGAQEPGMFKDVCEAFPAARKVLDDISQMTGVDMPKLLWESEKEVLSRSDNSQLAITAVSIATVKVLEDKGITPSAAMGFSLGEFPALYAAGVLTFEDVVKVVRQRGQIMQKVCEEIAAANEGHAPGMSAILGLEPAKVIEIASGIKDVYAANLNSVKQTVISGTAAGLDAAEKAFQEAGARRCVRLAVAGPFHSPLMQEAAVQFEKAIADVTFNRFLTERRQKNPPFFILQIPCAGRMKKLYSANLCRKIPLWNGLCLKPGRERFLQDFGNRLNSGKNGFAIR